MIAARFAPDETGRLHALKGLGLLDTPPERRFDRIVQLGRRLTACPIGVVSFVDERRVFFKSACGLSQAGVDLGRPFRDYWFCYHVVTNGDVVTV
ncbi:MAG: GGDEF domain-containing protein, partial [Acidimicrobiales bacterium]